MNYNKIIKYCTFFSLITFVTYLYLNSQNNLNIMHDKTLIKFESQEINMGNISLNEVYEDAFKFTNEGEHVLLIHRIDPSCGCTSVDYSKKPVKPGESSSFKIKFKPEFPGRFVKTIKVFSNTQSSITVLKLTGTAQEIN